MTAYKFEIDRVDKNIQKTKQAYFKMKSNQNYGAIEEMDEEQYVENDMEPGQDGVNPDYGQGMPMGMQPVQY